MKRCGNFQEISIFVKQLSLIHKAQITTIHSFCMNLIRDYFYVLGIDPNTVPGDEGRLSAIRKEILDDLLEEAYEKKRRRFYQSDRILFSRKK